MTVQIARPLDETLERGQKFTFDTNTYPFDIFVKGILECRRLSQLHCSEKYDLFDRAHDQQTKWHKKFYDFVTDDVYTARHKVFFECYKEFVRQYGLKFFPKEEALVVQRIPNLRIQLPNNLGVGEFHRDADYGHNPEERNFFVPLTPAVTFNTIWVESEPDKGDFAPMNAYDFGEAFFWNGALLRHGNIVNEHSFTRVSLDFRIIPHSQWNEQEGTSINTKMKFKIGEYYTLLEL